MAKGWIFIIGILVLVLGVIPFMHKLTGTGLVAAEIEGNSSPLSLAVIATFIAVIIVVAALAVLTRSKKDKEEKKEEKKKK